MEDELKTLLPEEIYTLESGEQVVVRPVPFGKIRIFSEALSRLFLRFEKADLSLEDVSGFSELFEVATEEVIGIMGIVLDKPREWFDRISISDGLGLLALIVEQNLTEEAKKRGLALWERVKGVFQRQSSI